MVFSCVIVLALLSFVTAIPHEYGVKTGAVAKAEANAAAGAFGVLPAVPLRIPSGSGFSGSFSKSSSSSFASSSSSASSSSYSFSGNNGIPGVGCLSGNCKSGESNFPSSFNGAPNTQITHHSSEASALAAAKASAESSTYFNGGSNAACQQGNCKGLSDSTKCGTGPCDKSSEISSSGGSESGIQTINSENKQNCLSGNCLPISNQHLDSTSNSDDIEVNYARNPRIFNPAGYRKPISQLNNGISSSTLSPENNAPKCNSPSCDTFLALTLSNNAQSFNPQKPATHLVTPNLRPTCTTHNCNTDSTVPNDINGKPSSYNVPILGTNPSFQHNIPYNPSVVPLPNTPSQTGYEANCGSNGCTSNSAQAHSGFVGSKTPQYSHLNYPVPTSNSGNFGVPYQTSTNSPLPCNTPNCGNFAVPNQSINPGWSNTIKPNFINTPVNQNVPTYNNMLGGPVGSTTKYPGLLNMVQPNNYANHNAPSYSEGFGGPNGALNSAVYPGLTGTAKPNLVTISNNQNGPKYTKGFGGPPGPIDASVYPGSFSPAKPDKASTESNLPLYTGGFGGPIGSVTAAVPANIFTTSKPNLNTKPQEGTYNSGFSGSAGALGTASTIQHNTSGYTPIKSNTPDTLSPMAANNFVQNNNPSGHVNSDVLQGQVNEKEKLPPYTGGFGGPSGLLKPNEYNMPSKLPSPVRPAMPCATFDCNRKPVSNDNYNKAGASATALANAAAVSYAGGFGAPPGLLQPEKSKTVNSNSDFKGENKNDQVNNEKTSSDYAAGDQQSSGVKKTSEDDFNDFLKQAHIADKKSAGSQNKIAGDSPVVNKNIKNDSDQEKEFKDYISQANIAGAFASAGAQAHVGGSFPSANNNYDNSDKNKMLNDYFAQANIADAVAGAGAQANVGGSFPSANNNYDNSDKNKMLNDYFAQANIADAVAGAGAQTNVADQDNFIALTGSNTNQNSGCNNNCKPNSNGGVAAGASASAKSVANAGSWATGFASSAAHAVAGASVKGGYGRR